MRFVARETEEAPIALVLEQKGPTLLLVACQARLAPHVLAQLARSATMRWMAARALHDSTQRMTERQPELRQDFSMAVLAGGARNGGRHSAIRCLLVGPVAAKATWAARESIMRTEAAGGTRLVRVTPGAGGIRTGVQDGGRGLLALERACTRDHAHQEQ